MRLRGYDYSQAGAYFVTCCTNMHRCALGTVMGYYKYTSTRLINATRGTAGMPVWQRHYFHHIVRGYDSPGRMRQYIENNPLHRHPDSLYNID
jgi:REP element-mobilizing transposase RayT